MVGPRYVSILTNMAGLRGSAPQNERGGFLSCAVCSYEYLVDSLCTLVGRQRKVSKDADEYSPDVIVKG